MLRLHRSALHHWWDPSRDVLPRSELPILKADATPPPQLNVDWRNDELGKHQWSSLEVHRVLINFTYPVMSYIPPTGKDVRQPSPTSRDRTGSTTDAGVLFPREMPNHSQQRIGILFVFEVWDLLRIDDLASI